MNEVEPGPKAPVAKGLIFVVDDNVVLAQYATEVLKRAGYEVRVFNDPKAVLEALKTADPKPLALVTDYEMGEINGLDLIISSHKMHPLLKTVLLSGTIDSAFISQHSATVHRFLSKPYQPPQLQNAVAELLQK